MAGKTGRRNNGNCNKPLARIAGTDEHELVAQLLAHHVDHFAEHFRKGSPVGNSLPEQRTRYAVGRQNDSAGNFCSELRLHPISETGMA